MSARPATDAHNLPVGPAVVPHRKNAAEWVMWLAAAPVVLLLRAITFATSRLRG
jgi:hypothetical protein